MSRSSARRLALLAVLAGLHAGCPGRPPPDAPGDAGADADGDVDDDGAPSACTPGVPLCFDRAVRECGEDGLPGPVLGDCASPPFDRCEVGDCPGGEEPSGPCCAAAEPFCRAVAEVEGKEPRSVEYRGFWEEDFACAGSIAEDGYNWSLWARLPSCEGPFVRVILSGYLEGWEPGSTYPLCRTWTSLPDVRVVLTADGRSYGNDDAGASPAEDCAHVSGSVTFHEYGARAGEPFRLTVDGALFDPGSGEVRALRVETSGLLLPYPS